MIQGEVYDSAR